PQRGEAAARGVLRSVLSRPPQQSAARRRVLRPIREFRHTVSDAGGFDQTPPVRPRCVGGWSHLLAGSRRRDQGRLLARAKREPHRAAAAFVQRGPGLVVLTGGGMTRRTLGLLWLLVAMSVTATGQQGGASSPRVVRVVAERFVFTPSEITVTEGTIVEFRIKSQ